MKINIKRNFFVATVVIIIIGMLFYDELFSAEPNLIVRQEKRKLLKGQYKGYNLIMISLGNVGVEHMSLYGYTRKTTPHLDKWAQDAVIFENFFSPASWTLPAATSLFTSLYPYTHKVILRNISNILNPNIKTLPEILKEYNYKTIAFTGGLDYCKDFGHMRGFEEMADNPNFTGFQITLQQAKDWLSYNTGSNFFLFIHGYDAHCPFTPPEKIKGVFSNVVDKNITVDYKNCVRGFKNSDNKACKAYYWTRAAAFGDPSRASLAVQGPTEIILTEDDVDYLRDLYDEEVLYVDDMIGNFLNSLNKEILDSTIIIIFSEHGEMFAKHGRFGRAGTVRGTLYDEVIHTPLIIKMPDKQSKRVNGLAQIIDIMPTIAEILDIPLFQETQGKSLLPLVNDDKAVNEYVYAGSLYNFFKGPLPSVFEKRSINESIRSCKWKLIREVIFNEGEQIEEETLELYNLQNDPNEVINIADKYPAMSKNLKKKLNKWAKRSKDFIALYPSTRKVSEEFLRDAKKYGYW